MFDRSYKKRAVALQAWPSGEVRPDRGRSSDGHGHGVIGGRPGPALGSRGLDARRELRPRDAQLIQARDRLVADRRVVGQVGALQAEDDVRVDAVQVAGDLAAALVIQAALQALDGRGAGRDTGRKPRARSPDAG